MRFHPWFCPPARRIFATLFCAIWLASEVIFIQDRFWIILIGGLTAYTIWHFFISATYRVGCAKLAAEQEETEETTEEAAKQPVEQTAKSDKK